MSISNFDVMTRSTTILMKLVAQYMKTSRDRSASSRADKIKSLSSVFSDYGGILSKVSQLVCMEDGEGTCYSDCKPFSSTKTTEFFKGLVSADENGLFSILKDVDYTIFKSGSIGQVYRATLVEGDKAVVIKVRYYGIKEQFDLDIRILRLISDYLFNFFTDDSQSIVINKLYEELDYVRETSQQKMLYKLWVDDGDILIPNVIDSLSNDVMVTSEYMEAISLFDFIGNSTQEERDVIGKLLIKFILVSLFKHGLFYCDIHYGNFIIKDRNKLCVVDFGSIVYMDNDTCDHLSALYTGLCVSDESSVIKALRALDIIPVHDNQEYDKYAYEFFKLQFQPFLDDDFEFTDQWLDTVTKKDEVMMVHWNLPGKCAYLNRINHGLYHILSKLKTNIHKDDHTDIHSYFNR